MTKVAVTEDVRIHLQEYFGNNSCVGPRILSQLEQHPQYLEFDIEDCDMVTELSYFAMDHVFGEEWYGRSEG